MARRRRSGAEKKKTRSVSSHRDAQRLVDMHGGRRGYVMRVNALHGVEHARTVYRLLKRQELDMEWRVRGIDKLELLVRVHRHLSVASWALDDLARALAPRAGESETPSSCSRPRPLRRRSREPLAPAHVVVRNRRVVIRNGARPRLHLPDATLHRHAARLLDAGTAIRHQRLGGGTVQHVVHGLGLMFEGLAEAILMDRPVPADLFDPAPAPATVLPERPPAPPSPPPPPETTILDFVRQAKRKLLEVWKLRIPAADFSVICE